MKNLIWLAVAAALVSVTGAVFTCVNGRFVSDLPSQSQPLGGSGGATTGPIFPPAWKTSVWYVDPGNSSGSASDDNNCTTSATPCLTWHEIHDHRWGCTSNQGEGCPRLQQNTTIHWLSNQVGNDNDPIYFSPMIENGAQVILQGDGNGTLIATGTLSSVTSKSRTGATGLNANITNTDGGAVTGCLGEYILNTTHSSKAWLQGTVYGSCGTGPWLISQPCQLLTVPLNPANTHPLEVDTWANSDAVSLYAPITVKIGRLHPFVEKYAGADAAAPFAPLTIYNLFNGGLEDFNVTAIATEIGGDMNIVESSSVRFINYQSIGGNLSVTGLFNSVTDNFYGGKMVDFNNGVLTPINDLRVYAGGMGPAVVVGGPSTILDGDFIFNGSGSAILFEAVIGEVFVPGNVTINADADITLNSIDYANHLYGPNTAIFNMRGQHRLKYSGSAVTAFQGGIVLELNGQTTACNGDNANLSTTCAIAITNTNLGTAQPTGFGGNASFPGGSAISNIGP